MNLFDLVAKIKLDSSEYEKGLDKAQGKASSMSKKLKTAFGVAGKAGVALSGAVVAGGAAIAGMAKKSADASDHIDKMSQKIGISREAYQELDFICSQSGASVDNLRIGMKTLTNQMGKAKSGTGEAADMFKRLGVSIYDSNGNMKDQETMLWESLEALQGVENQTERATIANKLFGKSGSDLMPLINGARGSITEMKNQAHELGLVLSDETIDAGVKLTDTIDQVKRSFSAITTNIGASFMPMIQSVLELILDNMPAIQSVMSNVFDVIGGLVGGAVSVLRKLYEYVSENVVPILSTAWTETIQPAIEGVFNAIKDVWENTLLPAFTAIKTFVVETILPAFMDTFPKIQEVVKGVFDRVKAFWDEVLYPVFSAVIDTVVNLLKPTFETNFEMIKSIVTNAFNNIKQIWDEFLFPAFQAIANFIVETLLPTFEEVWPKIQTAVTTVFTVIANFWNDVLYVAFTAIASFIRDTLLPAFEENWPKIKEAVTTAMSAIRNFWDHRLKPAFTKIIEFVKDIKKNFEEKFESARTAVETAFSAIQTAWETLKTTFETIKEKLGTIKTKFKTVFDAVKKKVETVFGKIQEFWDNTLGPVFDAISEKLSEIGTFWDETFGAMLTTVDNVWNGENGVKTTIKNAIETVKGFFDFEWQLPTPKLPHFGIERWESLFGLVDVPIIGISWYAKAYDNPWLFDSKGVLGGHGFGDRGNYQGGELVYSRDKLMQDIREATGERDKQPVTINIYQQPWQDAKELAREVGEILSNDYVREGAAYA